MGGFRTSSRLATALVTVLLLGLNAPAAQAATYNFSGDEVNLDITTGSADNGGVDIIGVTGTVLGYRVTFVDVDPGPGGAVSPDGLFIYDNILYPTSNPVFDIDGLLVQMPSSYATNSYANIWGNGSGNGYSLYTSANGVYPVQIGPPFQNGSYTGTLAATPLPSTWTMLIAGFLGLGLFAYRGTTNRSAAAAAA